MTIKSVSAVLKKYIVPIIICTVVFFGIAFGLNYFVLENTYTAETTLTVTLYYNDAAGNTRYDSVGSINFAKTYAKLLKSDAIFYNAREKIGMKNSADYSVNITNPDTTTLIKVSVEGKDPQSCVLLANAVGAESVEYIEYTTTFSKPVTVVEATVPKLPTGPARLQNTVIATVLGAVVAAVLAIVVSMLDTSIRSESDIEKVTDLPILASIYDYRKEIKYVYNDMSARDAKLFMSISERTRENVRTLLANIEFLKKDKQIRTLTIASTVYSEGKSSVSLMLASAMAEQGKRVLIVDMDFRTPTIGLLSKKRGKADLVDYLMHNNLSLADVAEQTDVEGVYIIDSLHENIIVANMIEDARFDKMLEAAKDMYDFVIFDTPPVSVYVDAALVSAHTDATIMLVRNGKVESTELASTLEQIRTAGTTTVGIVFTFTDANSVKVSNRNKEKIKLSFKNQAYARKDGEK